MQHLLRFAAGNCDTTPKCLIFLGKQALPRLFLAMRLYRIAFPHLLRRLTARCSRGDLIFTGGSKDRKYQARKTQ